MTANHGKVYLVGSGPGSTAYLTVRGYQLLQQADVLVYDALVDEHLLQLVPAGCLTLDVGKRGGQASTPQAEINRLLIEHCRQGRRVVRLKSGDPFIFGRSAAEIEALKRADCAFEVVPGISSALAAPLLAAIPLTDPVLSRCFAVFSAHDPDALNWEALSQIETLVMLMGSRQLPTVVQQLQRWGRSPQTPVAVIQWAGHPQQKIWIGDLMSIVQQTARQSLSPAVVVIGEVVGLRPYLEGGIPLDNEEQPPPITIQLTDPVIDSSTSSRSPELLSRLTVLVTRSAGQSSQFSALLQKAGVRVLEMPTLEIGPPSSWDGLDRAIQQLDQFDWLILTSTNGVDYFFDRLMTLGKDARSLASAKIAVVGQKTADRLQQHGLQPDFIPPDFVADSLIDHFPDRERLAGLKLLFPRVETGGREVLVNDFTAAGATVVEVAAYQSGCASAIAPPILEALQQHQIDVVTFASSKTVKCFAHLLALTGIEDSGSTPHSRLPGVCIASIGPQTSAACIEQFGRVDVEAEEYTLEGLTRAVVEWAKVPNRAV